MATPHTQKRSQKPVNSARGKPPVTVFAAIVIVIFFCTLSAADSIGFVPSYIDGSSPSSTTQDESIAANDTVSSDGMALVTADSAATLALSQLPELGENTTAAGSQTTSEASSVTLPARLEIPSIGLDLPVQNPSTTNVDKLDALLVNGPARYVNSAKLGAAGNVVIFGHSSHLPIVHNKMFQAFNKIPNLTAGDSITVIGANGKRYLYSVDSVVKADVNDETSISLAVSEGTKLTIVTCDTLAGKSARFVMTASFLGVE
jgi:LPXTG-site transpeptidase (sortase) family protein